jgi:hypothetical protein
MKNILIIAFLLVACLSYADSTVVHYAPMPQYYPPPPVQSNIQDYTLLGLVGTMVVSMLGLLTWIVRSDREDKHRITDAMIKLTESINSSKEANLLLAQEIKNAFANLNQRLDRIEADLNDRLK